MTSHLELLIHCDGRKLGSDCSVVYRTGDLAITSVRRSLKRQGWTRRHHPDRSQVDLCPLCSPLAKPSPTRGGRPRKARA